jgi:transposase
MAMPIVEGPRLITGGIDTHLDAHVAAVVDVNGGVLGVESFPSTTAGFAELCDWLVGFGEMQRVGVEGHRCLRRRGWLATYGAAGSR